MKLNFAFSQRRPASGSLLDFGFTQNEPMPTEMLAFSFSPRRAVTGRNLMLGIAQPPVSYHGHTDGRRQFLSSEAIGIGDYDLAVYIGGVAVDICKFTESMTITHGENESYACDFVMQENKGRPPRRINLYEWYGKNIVVELVHSGGRMRLYTGIVNSVQADFLGGKTRVGCTDRRERLIEKVPQETIAAIGYTSEAAHGKFLTKSDELARRLETVQGSFEFDVYGNGAFVPWKPAAPTRTIGDCEVYYREPSLRLAEVGQVVNKVEVTLALRFERLRQRNLIYLMNLGIGVCEYGKYGQLPTLKAVAEAVRQTGWTLGGFDFERIAPTGWYSCGGAGSRYGFKRAADNTAVVAGSFEVMKRWRQHVGEDYKLTLINEPSVKRYGELSDSVAYAVTAKPAEEWERNIQDDHRDGVVYKVVTGDRLFHQFVSSPRYGRQRLTKMKNGDYGLDLDDTGGSFDATWRVAIATARARIAASHRQNTLDLEIKFLPEISLRHSHRIRHTHFKGVVKVSRFVHTFDFLTGTGQTAVQYKFFQNAGGRRYDDTIPPPPPKPVPNDPPHYGQLWLGKVILEPKQPADNAFGMLYRKVEGYTLLKPEAFKVRVPDVEQQSTDSVELETVSKFDAAVPHDDVEIYL